MNCPACHSDRTNVMETRYARSPHRPEHEFYGIRRRRYCSDCSHRWTTIEVNAESFVNIMNLWIATKGVIDLIAGIPPEVFADMSDLIDQTKGLRTYLKPTQRPTEPDEPDVDGHY